MHNVPRVRVLIREAVKGPLGQLTSFIYVRPRTDLCQCLVSVAGHLRTSFSAILSALWPIRPIHRRRVETEPSGEVEQKAQTAHLSLIVERRNQTVKAKRRRKEGMATSGALERERELVDWKSKGMKIAKVQEGARPASCSNRKKECLGEERQSR